MISNVHIESNHHFFCVAENMHIFNSMIRTWLRYLKQFIRQNCLCTSPIHKIML